jgi:hypothetical protein
MQVADSAITNQPSAFIFQASAVVPSGWSAHSGRGIDFAED